MIVCGNEIVTSDALAEAGNFASALGATVYHKPFRTGRTFCPNIRALSAAFRAASPRYAAPQSPMT